MRRNQRQIDLVHCPHARGSRFGRRRARRRRAGIAASAADRLARDDDHRVLADETGADPQEGRSRADRRNRRSPAFAGRAPGAILPASDHLVETTKAGFAARQRAGAQARPQFSASSVGSTTPRGRRTSRSIQPVAAWEAIEDARSRQAAPAEAIAQRAD